MKRNLRNEIETALKGGIPDVTPLTFYDLLLPEGMDIRPLQKKGLSIAARRDVYRSVIDDVEVRDVYEGEGVRRTIYETPIGTLSELYRLGAYNAYAPLEHRIKTRDDYRIAAFIVDHTRYVPIYSEFRREQYKIANSGMVIAHTCYSPLLDLQIRWIGQERFCYELVDNEDALMSLYERLRKNHKEMYEVVAVSPAEYCLYGGNIVAEMVGPSRVRDYVLPCWQEFSDLLANENKKLGVHLDSENRLLIDIIRESKLYFIEAFTPPPDCSISVEEARRLWPGKILWINFPSSIHLSSEERIREATREILKQAGRREGFLMGVTEDIPVAHMVRSLSVILETIEEYSQ
jgi:hypothetical protein